MKLKWICRLSLASCLTTGAVIAAEEATPAAPSPWKTTLSAGGTVTSGNSKSSKANASILVEGEKASLGSVRTGAQLNYGDSTVDDQKTTDIDNAKAFANAKKTLSPMSFAYGDISFFHDTIAYVDYRVSAGPGGGAYLLKNSRTALSLEAGPSYIWEKQGGITDNYLALRVAERIDQTLSATAKCWQSLEYVPKIDDFEKYLLTAEIGVEAAINTRLGLRLVLQDNYDSQPGPGVKSNDLTLIGALSLKL